MKIRPTTKADTGPISAMLGALRDAGKRIRPCDPDFVRATYVSNPELVASQVAEDDTGRILGLQVLLLPGPDDPFDVPEGYGNIGTHVAPDAARQGIGRRLFAATLQAARAAALPALDANIAADNDDGLTYYEAMGFRTDRTGEGRIVKRLILS
ncbi:GNAT family N-acetyltransferase [Thalassococcus profundi]|uniref:GNAT family N-acetyltransferase n=1 Tax=Thalassococcus profundi TaxID=2282382 RepID=A0A369TPM1_9RHOB|nr:GNAT family N-acetyltransferase [Thalassococcus profundi]RDD66077.1 GNAT family N-acetyltransferase [Thalassococcus profundi]